MEVQFIFFLINHAFGISFKKSLPNSSHRDFLLLFLLVVCSFPFKSIIHFELISVYCARYPNISSIIPLTLKKTSLILPAPHPKTHDHSFYPGGVVPACKSYRFLELKETSEVISSYHFMFAKIHLSFSPTLATSP